MEQDRRDAPAGEDKDGTWVQVTDPKVMIRVLNSG
jgi:hypothetical protein